MCVCVCVCVRETERQQREGALACHGSEVPGSVTLLWTYTSEPAVFPLHLRTMLWLDYCARPASAQAARYSKVLANAWERGLVCWLSNDASQYRCVPGSWREG